MFHNFIVELLFPPQAVKFSFMICSVHSLNSAFKKNESHSLFVVIVIKPGLFMLCIYISSCSSSLVFCRVP